MKVACTSLFSRQIGQRPLAAVFKKQHRWNRSRIGVGSHASKRNECHQPASQEPELVPSGRRDSPQLPAVEVAPECLVPPASGMRALIERWIDHQDAFSVEYVVKPACIHVIFSGEVRQVNVWTLQYEKLTLAFAEMTDLCSFIWYGGCACRYGML